MSYFRDFFPHPNAFEHLFVAVACWMSYKNRKFRQSIRFKVNGEIIQMFIFLRNSFVGWWMRLYVNHVPSNTDLELQHIESNKLFSLLFFVVVVRNSDLLFGWFVCTRVTVEFWFNLIKTDFIFSLLVFDSSVFGRSFQLWNNIRTTHVQSEKALPIVLQRIDFFSCFFLVFSLAFICFAYLCVDLLRRFSWTYIFGLNLFPSIST